MKIFLGPAGIPLACNGNVLDGIKMVKDLGLNAMEIEFVHGVRMSLDLAKGVEKLSSKLGIKLSVHAPYFINLCNPEKVQASISRILQSVERAHYMNACVVVFHPGYYGNSSRDKCKEFVISACEEMYKKMKKNGWDDVYLGMETTGKVSQFGTIDELIDISRKINGCIPVIDFAHIYARSGGRINYAGIFDKLSSLKLKHIHSHFSGIEYGLKGERRHLPISQAGPDFEKLAKEILKRKLNITIISESPLLEKDSLVMKKIFENLGYQF